MLLNIFDINQVLTPIAIVLRYRGNGSGRITYRTVHIFGVRVAYWTVTP